MRILALVPRDAALSVAQPLLQLGHVVGVVASDRGKYMPDVPGAVGWTRGHLYNAVRAMVPEAIVTLSGDEDAALCLRVTATALPMGQEPEEHVLPWSLLDGDGLLELLSVLFPPVAPAELSEWLSGVQDHEETPAPPKRRRGSKAEGLAKVEQPDD